MLEIGFHNIFCPKPFSIEKEVKNLLLNLPRCTGKVAVFSRRYLDKRYNCEMIVDTASLAAWSEGHSKGVWSSNKPEQAARIAIPMWLRLADLSDDTVTIPPKEFFNVWHKYHDTLQNLPESQVLCYECGEVIGEVIKTETLLPQTDIFDVRKYEWCCPNRHLLYQEEIGRHADARKFMKRDMNTACIEEGIPIPSFLKNAADKNNV